MRIVSVSRPLTRVYATVRQPRSFQCPYCAEAGAAAVAATAAAAAVRIIVRFIFAVPRRWGSPIEPATSEECCPLSGVPARLAECEWQRNEAELVSSGGFTPSVRRKLRDEALARP